MDQQITQLLIVAYAIVPFCNGIVEIVKRSLELPSRFVPVASLIIGALLGAIFSLIAPNYNVVQLIMAGGIAGMASCGVYDIIGVKKDE